MQPIFANHVSDSRKIIVLFDGPGASKRAREQDPSIALELLKQSLHISGLAWKLLVAAIQAGEVVEPVLQLRHGHRQAQLGFGPEAGRGKRGQNRGRGHPAAGADLPHRNFLTGTTTLSQFGIELMMKRATTGQSKRC